MTLLFTMSMFSGRRVLELQLSKKGTMCNNDDGKEMRDDEMIEHEKEEEELKKTNGCGFRSQRTRKGRGGENLLSSFS